MVLCQYFPGGGGGVSGGGRDGRGGRAGRGGGGGGGPPSPSVGNQIINHGDLIIKYLAGVFTQSTMAPIS